MLLPSSLRDATSLYEGGFGGTVKFSGFANGSLLEKDFPRLGEDVAQATERGTR